MKIFVTGATGFAGQHYIHQYDSASHRIYGTSFPENPAEISRFDGKPFGKSIVWLDIRNEKDIRKMLRDIQPDWIFHFAAVSNVGQSWHNKRTTLETNLMGTFFLFEAAKEESHHSRLLFISSSDVYGVLPPEEMPLKENRPLHVVNPYAFTKAGGEMLCDFYHKIEGLDIVIGRPFPHTGPAQSSLFVCSDWAAQIARIEKETEEPVIHVGNLDVERDYTDVRDVVRAYRVLLEKGKSGEIYNICTGKAVKLMDVLRILLSFSKKKIKIYHDPEKKRKTDIPILIGDNTKINKETGWEPDISLEQSLSDLLEFWRKTV